MYSSKLIQFLTYFGFKVLSNEREITVITTILSKMIISLIAVLCFSCSYRVFFKKFFSKFIFMEKPQKILNFLPLQYLNNFCNVL